MRAMESYRSPDNDLIGRVFSRSQWSSPRGLFVQSVFDRFSPCTINTNTDRFLRTLLSQVPQRVRVLTGAELCHGGFLFQQCGVCVCELKSLTKIPSLVRKDILLFVVLPLLPVRLRLSFQISRSREPPDPKITKETPTQWEFLQRPARMAQTDVHIGVFRFMNWDSDEGLKVSNRQRLYGRSC